MLFTCYLVYILFHTILCVLFSYVKDWYILLVTSECGFTLLVGSLGNLISLLCFFFIYCIERCIQSSSVHLFLKQNKLVLPSFQHLLVTEGQSSQTHPALLWSLRTRESLRLKNKLKIQQTLLPQTEQLYSMVNDMNRGNLHYICTAVSV